MKKLLVIIEDDFELMGNGLGNVGYHQYVPATFLMKLAKKLGIKLTFMVDVLQQMEFMKHTENNYDLKLQFDLFEHTVISMIKNGFDVQLHLHPQWLNARFDGTFFHLSENWNIGRYDSNTQANVINKSVGYLENLIKPVKNDYTVHTFKAGSWGLQPSGSLLKNLSENGIKIVMGVRKGMVSSSAGINYNSLSEVTHPYFPDFSDITKIGKKGDLFVIPLCHYSPDLFTLAGLSLNILYKKIKQEEKHLNLFYDKKIPEKILRSDGLKHRQLLKFGWKPYQTHLKIGNQSFSYLKNSFDKIFQRLNKCEQQNIPVIIESHTKQYPNSYESVEKFLIYLREKFSDSVEFCDMTTILNHKLQHIFIRRNGD